MGERIRVSNLCIPDKWTAEQITNYQQKRKPELISAFLKEGLPSDQPWNRAYYINSRRKIWEDEALEKRILSVMKNKGKPQALVMLEEAAIRIY